ncbi:MAG TPA: hypothetical protein VGF28_07300 [Thermoanaerobaculia bacterium]
MLALTLFTLPTFAQDATLVPNRVKYSDTAPAATGRAGNAKIEAQALQFADGVTQIMLTTGSIEEPYTSGTGIIETVQYKDGGATENIKSVWQTPWFRMNRSDLARHQAVQFQAHVRGVDHREDIVTVDDTVKLAPDVALEALELPAVAPAGVPVNISAVLRERNGDTGARVNCVLLIDGMYADSVEQVWVDAGGTVTCSMLYAFPAPGDIPITVQAMTQWPAEYDHENNRTERSVTVAPPTAPAGEFDRWTATARHENFDYHAVTRYTDGSGFEQHDRGWRTSSRFDGTINAGVDVDQIGFAFSESTEGQVIESRGTSRRLAVSGPRPDGSRCGAYSGGRFLFGSICSNGSVTTLTFQRTASHATYLSRAWFEVNGVVDEWYYVDMTRVSGTRAPYGSTVEMDFTIYAGTRWWDVSPFITMGAFTDRDSRTTTCNASYCREVTDRVWGTKGTDAND